MSVDDDTEIDPNDDQSKTDNTKTKKNDNNNDNGDHNEEKIEEEAIKDIMDIKKQRELLQKILSVNVLNDMYNKKVVHDLPRIQVTDFKPIANTYPSQYMATVVDLSSKMPVIIDTEYTEDIYYKRLKNDEIVKIKSWEFAQLNMMKLVKVKKMVYLGQLPPLPPVPAVQMKYAQYKQSPFKPQIIHNTNNNNNNNTALTNALGYNASTFGNIASYTNLVNPLRSSHSQSVQQRIAASATHAPKGYKPIKSFNAHSTLLSNGDTSVTTSNNMDNPSLQQINAAAHATQQELLSQLNAESGESNSNSNNNSNSNSNSNEIEMGNASSGGPVFNDSKYQQDIQAMLGITGDGVPIEAHTNAPANRQLPLKKGLDDTILPGILAFGNLSQSQAQSIYNIARSQTLQVPIQQQSKDNKLDINQMLKYQKNPNVNALSLVYNSLSILQNFVFLFFCFAKNNFSGKSKNSVFLAVLLENTPDFSAFYA